MSSLHPPPHIIRSRKVQCLGLVKSPNKCVCWGGEGTVVGLAAHTLPPPLPLPFTNSSARVKGGDSETADSGEPNSQLHPHSPTHPNAFLICRKEAKVHLGHPGSSSFSSFWGVDTAQHPNTHTPVAHLQEAPGPSQGKSSR